MPFHTVLQRMGAISRSHVVGWEFPDIMHLGPVSDITQLGPVWLTSRTWDLRDWHHSTGTCVTDITHLGPVWLTSHTWDLCDWHHTPGTCVTDITHLGPEWLTSLTWDLRDWHHAHGTCVTAALKPSISEWKSPANHSAVALMLLARRTMLPLLSLECLPCRCRRSEQININKVWSQCNVFYCNIIHRQTTCQARSF